MKELLVLQEINSASMCLSTHCSSCSHQTPPLMRWRWYHLPKMPTPAPQERRRALSLRAVFCCNLVLSLHTTILGLRDKDYLPCWAPGKPASPTQVDNRAMHELAFSTNLMVSSQSLSSVLRKEKLNLAKSFSFFSLPLISYKSPGEPNIAKSCHETAGW